MSSGTNLPDSAQRLLALIVERELIGGEEPSISLQQFRPHDEDLLCDGEYMAQYLTAELGKRDSHLRVEPVEEYYFDFSPYSGRMDRVCYLALVDPQADTRKLFMLSATEPAIDWRPEQNSGPTFERDRMFYYGSRRQRILLDAVPAATLTFLEPFQQMVRAYVESRVLTADEAYDIQEVTKYKSWEKMELDSLIYIALALGTTLEEIIASDVTVT